MIGTIEELEKEIEQFQNNIMASGELVTLLRQMLDQVKQQNEYFDQQSKDLILRIDRLPGDIENANLASNQRVKQDVSLELTRSLQNFSDEQNRYIAELEQTRQQIYSCMAQIESQEKLYNEKTAEVFEKLDLVIDNIRSDNDQAINKLQTNVDKILADRNAEFAVEQQQYISAIQQADQTIKASEDKLDRSYKEFVETLEKMNIANLNEQNQQLKNELSKRTTILLVIAIIGIVLGVVGLFI